jgi:beta-1,2-mannobiose phosphorylase / 1,2-beta-oligomannan phosphorylase
MIEETHNLSTRKLKTTRSGHHSDLSRRISDKPIIGPIEIVPSDSRLQVIGVLNPTYLSFGGEDFLVFRVDERPCGQHGAHGPRRDNERIIPVGRVKILSAQELEIVDVIVSDDYIGDREPILPEEVRKLTTKHSGVDVLLTYISHLRIAKLREQSVTISEKPLLFPDSEFNQFGCEDPRAVRIDNQSYIAYTSVGRYGATAWLAEIDDTGVIKEKSIILGPDHKHTALFPEKIDNQYALLSRPLSRTYINDSGAWLFRSPDLKYWGSPLPVLMPRKKMWDSIRVGPSASPIRVDDNWLQLYYGVDEDSSYHIGAVILDGENPSKVIARSKHPLLSPILEWERKGRRADTVFSCGLQFNEANENLRIYYGAADTYIGAADVSLQRLRASLST